MDLFLQMRASPDGTAVQNSGLTRHGLASLAFSLLKAFQTHICALSFHADIGRNNASLELTWVPSWIEPKPRNLADARNTCTLRMSCGWPG